MKKTSPEVIATEKQEAADWESELQRLQGLLPDESKRNHLRETEIPGLEGNIQQFEAELPEATKNSESVCLFTSVGGSKHFIHTYFQALRILDEIKEQLKELNAMKNNAAVLSRLQGEVINLQKNITRLEESLMDSGSTKTREEVQQELEAVADEM